MEANDLQLIHDTICSLPFVNEVQLSLQENQEISGVVDIQANDTISLKFEIRIFPSYPYKLGNVESIIFFNKDLIHINHVMCDGSICIHTRHNTDIEDKLKDDFDSLKNWIEKYFNNKEVDANYEHIIISDQSELGRKNAFLFTEVNHEFTGNEFGEVGLSLIENGFLSNSTLQNSIVNFFVSKGSRICCGWSKDYQNPQKLCRGAYIFLPSAPAHYGKCLYQNWEEFNDIFPSEFIDYLQYLEQKIIAPSTYMPLFVGYPTVQSEIHWNVALIRAGSFPMKGVPIYSEGKKTGKWQTKLNNSKIDWCISCDCSPKYFFGRGTLDSKIVSKRILIIGVGAIGSVLATTLARCGAKYIDLIDYDIKEPENICRSEYEFIKGYCNKTEELRLKLCSISPFVEVNILMERFFEAGIKLTSGMNQHKTFYSSCLAKYDIVFDCSTDDDLMHILNNLEFAGDMWNLSITNHAKEMVVGLYPNIYKFVTSQFSNILENDLTDLHNPTGCWNPTFKANYNDISLLTQMAIKQINLYYSDNIEKRCFSICTSNHESFNIEIKQY